MVQSNYCSVGTNDFGGEISSLFVRFYGKSSTETGKAGKRVYQPD